MAVRNITEVTSNIWAYYFHTINEKKRTYLERICHIHDKII